MGLGHPAGQVQPQALVGAVAGRVAGVQQPAGLAQRLGGKARAAVPHPEHQGAVLQSGGQPHGAAGGGVAHGVVQQVVHRPGQPPLLRRKAQPGGQVGLHLKGQPGRRAQRPAHPGPPGRKAGGFHRGGGFLPGPRGGGCPQVGQVLPGPVGPPADRLGAFPGGGGQVLLGQQLGMAGDHGQRGLQVVGQRGDLLGPLLVGGPLGLQAVGQVPAQRLHGLQRGVQLPDAPAGKGRPAQVAGADPVRRGLQPLALPPQPPGGAPGGQRHHQHLQPGQHPEPQQLEVRQHALQRPVGIGHREGVDQQADRPVGQCAPAGKQRVEHPPRRLAVPAAQRPFQLPAGQVGGQHGVRVGACKQHIPAQRVKAGGRVGKGGGGPALQRFQGGQAGLLGGVGRQHQAGVHDDGQPEPPAQRRQGAQRHGQHQVAGQHPGQAGRRRRKSLHASPSFHR